MANPGLRFEKETLLARRRITAAGCWEWTGGTWQSGYGRVKINRRIYRVSRLAAHFWLRMEINSAEFVCHHCDNKLCFNPKHLFLGDNKANQQDALAKGRLPRGEAKLNSKFKEADIREIRRRRKAGETLVTLAKAFNTSFSQIHRITKFQSWKHVR